MSVRGLCGLTRILRCDVGINSRILHRRVKLIPAQNLNSISRCLSTEISLENQITPTAELPVSVPERFEEKGIGRKKPKDLHVNLQDFADTYPVLQTLIDIGVEIYRFNHDQSLCKFLMKLDFDENIKPYLIFLHNNGVPEDKLAEFFTRNPYIIQCDLDDLDVRINYLESKKFTKDMISTIITNNPKWLSHSVEDVDSRLGEVQATLELSGDQIRSLVTSFPGIISMKSIYLKLNMFTIKEEFGISLKECQSLILKSPRLLRTNNGDMVKTFHYLTYNMAIPVNLIIQHPIVLKCRPHKLKLRHMFLQRLGRAQYNPKLPGYVSLTDLTTTDDEEFCTRIAMSSIETFYKFQKIM